MTEYSMLKTKSEWKRKKKEGNSFNGIFDLKPSNKFVNCIFF